MFILGTLLACQPKGNDDPFWKEESQNLSLAFCDHLEKCITPDEWNQIPEKWRTFTQGKLEENNCQAIFRKSRIYSLQVRDVERAKSAYRSCTTQTLQKSCTELQAGALTQIPDCELVRLIQKGKEP